MIVIDLTHPRHLFTLIRNTPGWDEPPSMATVRPGAYLWDSVRRPFRALGWFAVRVLFALLHLFWELTVIVEFSAEVAAEDSQTAVKTLEEFLRDAGTLVVVHSSQRPPAGWRDLGNAPIEDLSLGVPEPGAVEEQPLVWWVRGVVTATITVPARDAGTHYIYADLDPFSWPRPIMSFESWDRQVRRTPVRRRPVG